MDSLCYPVTYTVHGKPCTAFSFVKKNKTTATYEIRVTDSFSFRIYLPLELLAMLTKGAPLPNEVCLLACLPENLETRQIASFEEFPSAD